MAPVRIYSDGGCIGNPGPGGWAAVCVTQDGVQEFSGRFRNTTNNRMELRAAIEGLERVKGPREIIMITDSTYLRNGITKWIDRWLRNNWRTANRKPVKNRDLWMRLLRAVERHSKEGLVIWEWTKGHAGDELNERADSLANQAARSVTEADPEDIPDEITRDAPPDRNLPLFNDPQD